MSTNANGLFRLQNEGVGLYKVITYRGLMTQDTLENLGFTEENSIKTEEERKRELAMKFVKLSDEARNNVQNYFKDLYKSEGGSAENVNRNNKNI
jgi:hypothetical protein